MPTALWVWRHAQGRLASSTMPGPFVAASMFTSAHCGFQQDDQVLCCVHGLWELTSRTHNKVQLPPRADCPRDKLGVSGWWLQMDAVAIAGVQSNVLVLMHRRGYN